MNSVNVPGRYLNGLFTPDVAGPDFLAAFVANCFFGALPPVDFLVVCFVRAIVEYLNAVTVSCDVKS